MASIFPFILVPALLLVVIGDLRHRIIPNWLNGAIALTAPAWWLVSGLSLWPGVAIQVALAAALLGLFACAFALGMMGGGDVKLIAALGLWLAPGDMARLLVVMALAGGVLTLVTLVAHRIRAAEGAPEVPYGVAIAFAAMVSLGERYLYQFG